MNVTRVAMQAVGWGSDDTNSGQEQYGGPPKYTPNKIDLALDEACLAAGGYDAVDGGGDGDGNRYARHAIIRDIRDTIKHVGYAMRRGGYDAITATTFKRAVDTVNGIADLGVVDTAFVDALCKTVRAHHAAQAAFSARNEAFSEALFKTLAASPYMQNSTRIYRELEAAETAKKEAAAAGAARRAADEAAAFEARVAAAVAASLAERDAAAETSTAAKRARK